MNEIKQNIIDLRSMVVDLKLNVIDLRLMIIIRKRIDLNGNTLNQ